MSRSAEHPDELQGRVKGVIAVTACLPSGESLPRETDLVSLKDIAV